MILYKEKYLLGASYIFRDSEKFLQLEEDKELDLEDKELDYLLNIEKRAFSVSKTL